MKLIKSKSYLIILLLTFVGIMGIFVCASSLYAGIIGSGSLKSERVLGSGEYYSILGTTDYSLVLGNESEFFLIQVITNPAIVGSTEGEATLNGILNDLDTAAPINLYFEYGLDTSYSHETTKVMDVDSVPYSLSVVVTGLTAGATYHYRIVGENGDILEYGNDQYFYLANTGNAGESPGLISVFGVIELLVMVFFMIIGITLIAMGFSKQNREKAWEFFLGGGLFFIVFITLLVYFIMPVMHSIYIYLQSW
jgi:hypothetical protein